MALAAILAGTIISCAPASADTLQVQVTSGSFHIRGSVWDQTTVYDSYDMTLGEPVTYDSPVYSGVGGLDLYSSSSASTFGVSTSSSAGMGACAEAWAETEITFVALNSVQQLIFGENFGGSVWSEFGQYLRDMTTGEILFNYTSFFSQLGGYRYRDTSVRWETDLPSSLGWINVDIVQGHTYNLYLFAQTQSNDDGASGRCFAPANIQVVPEPKAVQLLSLILLTYTMRKGGRLMDYSVTSAPKRFFRIVKTTGP